MGLPEKFSHLLEQAQQSVEYWRDIAVTDFTRELHDRMRQLGTTHTELARLMGVSVSNLRELLEDCDITLESMAKLAKALGCRVRIHLESYEPARQWSQEFLDLAGSAPDFPYPEELEDEPLVLSPEHQQAQDLSSRAALYLQESKTSEARKLFAEAARLEQSAYEKTPAGRTRTRGILAVSFVALLFKSGQYDVAEREITSLLADPSLPSKARDQLLEILSRVSQPPRDRAVSGA